MSYQEKNITVSLMSTILILGFYLLKMFQMYQTDSLNSTEVFSLWVTIIVVTIIVNIVALILTHIVFSVMHAIKTKTDKEEPSIEDERDKLIGLKGTRVSYIVLSIGVLLSMLTMVFNKPALVMFSLLIFFSLLAEIVGDISRLFYYRRGV
jgi:uncharacterized membrane protein